MKGLFLWHIGHGGVVQDLSKPFVLVVQAAYTGSTKALYWSFNRLVLNQKEENMQKD